MWEMKHSDRNEAEYYCWAMTQAAERSCCSRSGCYLLPGRLCAYLCSWMYLYSIPTYAIRLIFRNVILHKSGGASALWILTARKKYTIFSFHTTCIFNFSYMFQSLLGPSPGCLYKDSENKGKIAYEMYILVCSLYILICTFTFVLRVSR